MSENIKDMYENYEENNDNDWSTLHLKDIGELNWAVDKCNNMNKNLQTYRESVEAQISLLKDELEQETKKNDDKKSWLLYQINLYIKEHELPTNKTKTQEKLKLATGTFVRKFPKTIIVTENKDQKKDENLINYCVDNNMESYLNISPTVKWGEFKKIIQYTDKDINIEVIDKETGEIKTVFVAKNSVYRKDTGETLNFMFSDITDEKLDIIE